VDTLSVEDKLKFAIINGEKIGRRRGAQEALEELLEEALASYSALELINTVLLDGMKTWAICLGRARCNCLPCSIQRA